MEKTKTMKPLDWKVAMNAGFGKFAQQPDTAHYPICDYCFRRQTMYPCMKGSEARACRLYDGNVLDLDDPDIGLAVVAEEMTMEERAAYGLGENDHA